MAEPIVRLTGAPKPDTSRADAIFGSSAIQRHIAGRQGKRYAPDFRAPRVYTGRNYSPQTRPRHQGETAQQMPNYNQLTNFERKLYEVLPGFSESSVGKAVQRFSESWAGKALGYLDVLAEGAERVGGLASQFNRAAGNPEEMSELQASLNSAWYAGSLAGDMMNLPTFTYDDDRNITGMTIPDALPGAAGIADARNQISALMDQGSTASEALQQVKDGYYESLGALQIRAQLNDLYVHVLGDPINYVFPFIKPVERIKALSYFASSTRWSDEVIDVARTATKALRADDLSDIQKLTALDEVKQWAKVSGKFIGDKGDEFTRAVEANDLGKVADMMDDVIKDVGLNTRQRIAINITGGKDPFKVPETRWEKFYDKMPWRLTPTSRAYEYVTTIQDNVGAHIINAFDDEVDIVNALVRASAGATGEELGHAFLTIEGRAVQGTLKGFEQEAINLLNQVKAIGPEKELLADLAQLVGKSEEELMGIMKGGDFASVAKMTENAMSPQQLEVIFSKLDDMPYTTRLFKYKLMNRLADRSAQVGALMFGVKQRGFVQKLAQAVKSAETLAFLRINPGYMVRNVLNNEVTMIARGAGLGWKDLQDAGKYFDIDFEPVRMKQGFGAIGETFAHPGDVASEVLGDVLTGEAGKLDAFSRRVNDIPLGKFDMGKLSAKFESNASKRAFTTSYIRGWNQYFWKPGTGFDEVGTYLPTRIADQIKAVDEGLMPAIEKFVASARTPKELRSKVFKENLNLSINNIIDEASETIGYDITKSVPPEIIASIRDGLEEAAKKGRIPTFMADLRAKLAAQLDEVTPQIVKKVTDDVASQVVAEGPQSFPKILSDAMDETYNLGIYHARRDAELAEIARSVAPDNPELAHQLWKQMAKEADDYYKRDWQRLDATLQGFKKAAVKDKDLARIADEAIENFRIYKNGWKKFWKSKRTRGDSYWDAVREGKKSKVTWEDVASQTKKEYDEMIVVEDTLQREMDNIVARTITDDAQRQRYLAGQADLRDYIRRDKEQVSDLFEKMKNATADEREALYQELVTERIPRLDAIREKQFVVTKALEGDPVSIQKLEQVAANTPEIIIARSLDDPLVLTSEEVDNLIAALTEIDPALAKEYGQALFARRGEGRIEDITEFAEEGADTAAILAKAEANIAEADANLSKATEKVRKTLGIDVEEAAPAVTKTYVGDYKHLKKGVDAFDAPEQLANDEWWLTRGFPALDEIEKSAITQASKPELKWTNLPDETKTYLNNYIEHVSGQMGDARYASTRFAEFGRDAALLNYSRRYNYNTWLGTIMPYEFWTTHSMMKWALHSIDRPAMLTSYLRIQEFMNTAGAPGQALPQRLKGQFRIPMPFLPDWAGDSIFFDPLRSMIPIQNFTYGYEEEVQRRTQLEGKTEYILNDMVENGEIRSDEAEIAILDKRGDLWDKAQQMAIDDNEDLAFNAWDFASLLSSPHAPLDWAAKSLQGRKEDIGPFMPASRTIKGVAGLMGVDWTRSPYNMEARVRTELGLPAFDKWDDYRVDRMLSNMTALGEITTQEALRAMIEREGPAYDEAIKKANFEFGIGAVGSTFGIPSKAYPEGEFLQRSLDDDFFRAIEMRDEEGGADALTNFFELHPEYETRLALHKPPEERLRQFLIDDLWNIYLDFPKLTKDELKDQLGDGFYTKFLNKDTRSYDSIEMSELQIWLKLMGGDPPGTLESEPAPIDLADPEVAWRAQVFYDTRTTYFPDWWEIQSGYYDIPEENKAGRKAYKANNPSLEPYWEWRRDWMHRNPEVVPYLSDKFEFKYSSPQAEQRAEQPQPWLTWNEWTQYMGPNMANLMEDHFVRGYDIPNTFQDKAEELGQQLGISYEEVLSLMEESLIAR